MNIQAIVKVLVIFWGIILSLIVIKEIIPMLPNNLDFLPKISFSTHSDDTHSDDTNNDKIYFPLQKQYGLMLTGKEGCIRDYKAGIYKKGFNYSTASSCINNDCSLIVSFTQKIPETLSLYIKKNGACQLEKINVPKELNTIGYMLDLKLTDAQKSTLGILKTNKIRLEHAKGYEITPQRQLYFYDHKRDQDVMLIDDKKIGDIFFSKHTTSKDTDHSQADTSKKKKTTKIAIPHPKDLFTYTCDSKVCKKEANTYVLNIDGLYFIPSTDFIRQCMLSKQSSIYCKDMTIIGTIEHFKKPSPRLLSSIKNFAKNPEFNDSLEAWEQERFEKVQKKVASSLQ